MSLSCHHKFYLNLRHHFETSLTPEDGPHLVIVRMVKVHSVVKFKYFVDGRIQYNRIKYFFMHM